jgi:hypothetical protein
MAHQSNSRSNRYRSVRSWTAWFPLLGLAVANTSPGAGWTEGFDADPRDRGWSNWGDPALFEWRAENQALRVTWDSSRPNSYFYRPLPRTLCSGDSFRIAFDLTLDDVRIGTTPGKPYTFELAAGLINLANATNANFLRGVGIDAQRGPRNLIEFDYFPDSGFGATIAPTVVSSNNQFAASFNIHELKPGVRYHVELEYSGFTRRLVTRVRHPGGELTPIGDVILDAALPDFNVDALAIASYSDDGQTPPEFAGSIRALGWVDDIDLETADAPEGALAARRGATGWELWTFGKLGHAYRLQHSSNLVRWLDAGERRSGSGCALGWLESPRDTPVFYRIAVLGPSNSTGAASPSQR